MLGLGWPHLIMFAIVALVLFGGKGKISDVMGDVAKGIKSFKKGLADDPDPAKSLDATAETVVNKAAEKTKS